MMVPGRRLIFACGVVVLPFAALAGAMPDSAVLCATVIAAFGVIVLFDAVLGLGLLEGIRAELPPVVRLSKDREGVIPILVTTERNPGAQVRLGLPFPKEITSPDEDIVAVLPEESRAARVMWRCTPTERGNYVLDRCYLERLSPWGLWAFRHATPSRCEVRVYPNLLTERKYVGALFLNRGTFGVHTQRQVGKGREFEKLREYIPGDSYDEIHWKATAKRGRPVTKVFQIERTQEVYIIIDASRLSARRPDTSQVVSERQDANQLERFLTAALILCLAAERQGDLFGLAAFSDKPLRFVRARNGKAHYGACRDALYALQPQSVSPDFDELFTFLRLRLRRRALLVFLTNLDDPVLAESFVRNIELIRRQHLVLVNMPALPNVRPIFSDENVVTVDDVYDRLGGHAQWFALKELERLLHRRGVAFSLLDNERMCAQLVSQYVNVKRRQAL